MIIFYIQVSFLFFFLKQNKNTPIQSDNAGCCHQIVIMMAEEKAVKLLGSYLYSF